MMSSHPAQERAPGGILLHDRYAAAWSPETDRHDVASWLHEKKPRRFHRELNERLQERRVVQGGTASLSVPPRHPVTRAR